jgi:hypothetical protein
MYALYASIARRTHFFQVWTIRDGNVHKNVHKMEFFRHHTATLKAAGLRE